MCGREFQCLALCVRAARALRCFAKVPRGFMAVRRVVLCSGFSSTSGASSASCLVSHPRGHYVEWRGRGVYIVYGYASSFFIGFTASLLAWCGVVFSGYGCRGGGAPVDIVRVGKESCRILCAGRDGRIRITLSLLSVMRRGSLAIRCGRQGTFLAPFVPLLVGPRGRRKLGNMDPFTGLLRLLMGFVSTSKDNGALGPSYVRSRVCGLFGRLCPGRWGKPEGSGYGGATIPLQVTIFTSWKGGQRLYTTGGTGLVRMR